MEKEKKLIFLAKLADFLENTPFNVKNKVVMFDLDEKEFMQIYSDVIKGLIKDENLNGQFILNIGDVRFIFKTNTNNV